MRVCVWGGGGEQLVTLNCDIHARHELIRGTVCSVGYSSETVYAGGCGIVVTCVCIITTPL